MALCVAAGCGRSGEPAGFDGHVEPSGLASSHLFAGFTRSLESPPRVLPQSIVPLPLQVGSLPAEEAADPVNFDAIVEGLQGRVQALLDRQERTVRAREQLTAAQEVEQARMALEPELEEQVRQIDDSLYSEQHNLRIKQAALRQQIEFYRALMRARQRVEPGAGGEALQKQIDAKSAELADLEAKTAASLAEMDAAARKAKAEVQAAFNARVAEIERSEKQKASERASKQIDQRRATAMRASDDFVKVLASRPPAREAPGITGKVAPVSIAVPAARDRRQAAKLREAGRTVQALVRRDAALAAKVASEVGPPSLLPGASSRNRELAEKILGAPRPRRE